MLSDEEIARTIPIDQTDVSQMDPYVRDAMHPHFERRRDEAPVHTLREEPL